MLDFLVDLFLSSLSGGEGVDGLVQNLRSRRARKQFARTGSVRITAAVRDGESLRSGFLWIERAALRQSVDPNGAFRPVTWPLAEFRSFTIDPITGSVMIPAASPLSNGLHLYGPDTELGIAYDACYDEVFRLALTGAGLAESGTSSPATDEPGEDGDGR